VKSLIFALFPAKNFFVEKSAKMEQESVKMKACEQSICVKNPASGQHHRELNFRVENLEFFTKFRIFVARIESTIGKC